MHRDLHVVGLRGLSTVPGAGAACFGSIEEAVKSSRARKVRIRRLQRRTRQAPACQPSTPVERKSCNDSLLGHSLQL